MLRSSPPVRVHPTKLQYFNTKTCHVPLEGYVENTPLPQKRGHENITEFVPGLRSVYSLCCMKPWSLFLSHEYLILEK